MKKDSVVEGQMTLDEFSNFCTNAKNYVVQANSLVRGKQNLKVNSAKLIRAAIMQIKPEDTFIAPYIVSIKDLSELFGVSKSNLYRDIENITDDIIKNPVEIKEFVENKVRWVKIPWVSICAYQEGVGVAIQLNELLKPYILNLKDNYTQYVLDGILSMKSAYAIRIFEMIQEHLMTQSLKVDKTVELKLDEIRDGCCVDDKYQLFGHLRERVIEPACKEINEKTIYRVEVEDYVMEKRKYVSVRIHVRTIYGKIMKNCEK